MKDSPVVWVKGRGAGESLGGRGTKLRPPSLASIATLAELPSTPTSHPKHGRPQSPRATPCTVGLARPSPWQGGVYGRAGLSRFVSSDSLGWTGQKGVQSLEMVTIRAPYPGDSVKEGGRR